MMRYNTALVVCEAQVEEMLYVLCRGTGDVSLSPLSIWPDVPVEGRFRNLKPLADLRRRHIRVFHERLDLREVFFGERSRSSTNSAALSCSS